MEFDVTPSGGSIVMRTGSSKMNTRVDWDRYARSATFAIPFLLLVLAFVGVALRVDENPTHFDQRVASWIGRDGTHEGGALALHFWDNVTSLGSGPLVGLIVTMVLGYLILARHGRTAFVVALVICLAAASGFLLKGYFERPRPMDIAALLTVDGYSFPSGHSVMSGTTYPILSALLARVVEGRRLKAYCLGSGVILMVLIGISRVYLGVHHATDVLAGWAVGLAWSLVAWVVLTLLQERGVVEEEPIAEEVDETSHSSHA